MALDPAAQSFRMRGVVMTIAWPALVLGAGSLFGGHAATLAIPFWAPEPTPFAKDLDDADVVIFGLLSIGEADADGRGAAEVEVLTVIKDRKQFITRKRLTLNRRVPTGGPPRVYYVLFAEVYKGELDFYRGVRCSGPSDPLVRYLRNVQALGKPEWATSLFRFNELAFYFGHLEHGRPEIAQDAFRVFCHASYDDLKRAARTFDANKLTGWLADKAVPEERKELYRVLLVLCRGVPKR
jgi:hypothetical protein